MGVYLSLAVTLVRLLNLLLGTTGEAMNMTVALLDSACITSVIDCLHCQKLEAASPWAYKTAIEATAELITNPHFGLAPSPEGARASVGDFGEIQKHLSLRPSKPLFTESVAAKAEQKASNWFRNSSIKFGQSFREQMDAENFKAWLNHEIDFIWKNHTESQRGLFNKKLIPDLTILMGKSPEELEELQQLSGNWQEVQRLAKTRRSDKDFVLLSEAYAGAFFLRGIYHDYVARLSGYTIMPHRLRRISGFLPQRTKTPLHFENSPTTSYLADLILQCARNEQAAHRAATYAVYVSNARQSLDSLDLSPKSTIEDEIEAAARAGKTIKLHAKPAWVYNALDAGIALLSGGITSFSLDPFYGFAVGGSMWMVSRNENIGLRLGKAMFDTESRFKAMLAGPPGRLGANWN